MTRRGVRKRRQIKIKENFIGQYLFSIYSVPVIPLSHLCVVSPYAVGRLGAGGGAGWVKKWLVEIWLGKKGFDQSWKISCGLEFRVYLRQLRSSEELLIREWCAQICILERSFWQCEA